MTDRLYYTDSYLREFDAAVVDRADDGRRVYLDRSAFYPTSGGQPFDTGLLGGIPVTEVVDEDDRIAHVLARPLEPGAVTGTIDWARRFDHMQQHTGQHLLSAVFAGLTGHATTSVHFGPESSTLDLDTGSLEPAQVGAVEERANEVVTANRPVRVEFVSADAATGLRKSSDREGVLRIVIIEGLDRSACGGTHLAATGEIGPILIRKLERVKKTVRVEFLCGARAVRRARADHDLLARIAAPYSAAPADLPGLLDAQRQELREMRAANRELAGEVDARHGRELYDAAAPGADGVRRIIVRREGGTTIERLRGLAQSVTSLPQAVFVGTISAPATILLATSPDSGVDAGPVLREVLAKVGGRGGGNPRLAQGSVPPESLDEAVAALSATAPPSAREP
ncbi:MAG TPA: DHHA1 domain-containing protein [Gemmatimonadales bacterium]|nr:DHHA1 domain-containing protein [Gemmatimonadales bacterium]